MSDLVKTGSKYSDEHRRKAVVEYCVKGVMTKVSETTGIPETTLAHWKNKSVWWDDKVAEVRSEINEQILAQNLQIAKKAGENIMDSLEHGDEKLVWDKAKGEHVIKHVKPSGRDAAVIGGIVQDKARVQQNMPTSIISKQESIESLAKKFTAIANDCLASDRRRKNSIPGESEEIE